ncbi:MAG: type II toxin-antitoxin system Phd/YefM family antitoxin [Treponema sp.]|nr:type II toxin-antitoxin system Phd/YefM family antitoxin [Treponema sp.]MCI6591917.1 type II toxin-antitoxin system Phd/YefM family antitoxin [Spirochaetia bacterium]MDD7533211.1 type II toxin-antitoxin system Phd/YefM family antitoxin [Treponema sp.]MDY5758270.1 type II toxin-antitoxin system Phd/YefM family antitoxin [Treponema sp.]MDY5817259.1 type II toxin-antitoxin system Phd/YefM family antitoxin [Treponema sp.]
MLQIRPVSDLRNKFSDIETLVAEKNSPVFLTKNGYGSMVLMSLSMYENLTENIEAKLDEADIQAANDSRRLSHDEVFSAVRARIKAD